MPLVNVSGYLYDAQGNVVTQGLLHVTLGQDMTNSEGNKIAPFTVTVDLSATAGLVDINIYNTVGATPANLSYKVEFDPNPLDTSKPIKNKDGYWRNYWVIPNQSSVSLGSLVNALRVAPAYSATPPPSTTSSLADTVFLGTGTNTTKRIVADTGSDPDPEIRYNVSTGEWEYSNDGVSFSSFGTGGGGGGSVGGDLSGTTTNATVIAIRGSAVSVTAPSVAGQFLRWSGTEYVPSLDGSQFTGLNASNLASGTVPLARISGLTNTQIAAGAAIDWTKISKSGSSLADLTTRDAGDLNTGTIAVARLPIATDTTRGVVYVDGTTITVNLDGRISAVPGGILTNIDATNIADGSVDNTAFQNIAGLDQTLVTTSTPQWARIGLGGAADSSAVLTVYGQLRTPIEDGGNSGAAKTIDWNTSGIWKVTLTANCTLTLSNPKDSRYIILLHQDAVGGRTVTWPGNVVWPGGVAPTLTAAAAKMDLVALVYDAALDTYYGSFNLNF